jgi:hypothetical protein
MSGDAARRDSSSTISNSLSSPNSCSKCLLPSCTVAIPR